MFRWLRRLFRSPIGLTAQNENTIMVRMPCGDVVQARAIRAVGLFLLCSTPKGTTLVRGKDALQKDKFWGVWKKLGGADCRWESDQSPVDLSQQERERR